MIDTQTVGSQATESPPARGDASLSLLFEERCEEVMDLLSRRWWSWRRPWDAERRNNLGRLLSDLGEARRLEAARSLPDGTRAHLRTLLRRRIVRLSFDALLELRDELRKALIPIGDEAYISALVEDERARQAAWEATGRSSVLLWRELHAAEPPLGDATAVRLLAFAEARRGQHRIDRSRVRLRQHVLLLLAPVLALLAAGAAVASGLLIDQVDAARLVLLVVCAGGLGALLSGVRLLREELVEGADLRAFMPGLIVQPLLGAVAGLLLLLVGETGILGPTAAEGDVWARAGLLAFAAGFAEPLVVRMVSRIAGMPGDELAPRPTIEDSSADPHGRLISAAWGRPGAARVTQWRPPQIMRQHEEAEPPRVASAPVAGNGQSAGNGDGSRDDG